MTRPGMKALFHVGEHLLLAAAVLGIGLLFTAGFWLQNGDAPAKCDVMVVLGGNFVRPAYAAELYRLGMAGKVYVGRVYRKKGELVLDRNQVAYPRQEEVYRALLVKKGVPPEAIRYFGDDLLSTVQEAEAMALELGPGPGSLLVVTSPYHARRAGMIFRSALPDWDIRVVGTPAERMPAAWWTGQDSARTVLLEIPKTIFYLLGGRFRSVPGQA